MTYLRAISMSLPTMLPTMVGCFEAMLLNSQGSWAILYKHGEVASVQSGRLRSRTPHLMVRFRAETFALSGLYQSGHCFVNDFSFPINCKIICMYCIWLYCIYMDIDSQTNSINRYISDCDAVFNVLIAIANPKSIWKIIYCCSTKWLLKFEIFEQQGELCSSFREFYSLLKDATPTIVCFILWTFCYYTYNSLSRLLRKTIIRLPTFKILV